MTVTPRLCLKCYYARDRRDIAGVYCTGKWLCKDGKCEHYKYWRNAEQKGGAGMNERSGENV